MRRIKSKTRKIAICDLISETYIVALFLGLFFAYYLLENLEKGAY